MKSVFQMLEDLEEFEDELTPYERGLVANCMDIARKDGGSTRRLTEKQVDAIDRTWTRLYGKT